MDAANMTRDFILPDLGEGVHEGQIMSIMVAEGQSVREDEPLIEVETDKARVEIPSPYTGIVARVHVSEQQLVHVGDVMFSFSDGSEAPDVASAKNDRASANHNTNNFITTNAATKPCCSRALRAPNGTSKRHQSSWPTRFRPWWAHPPL